MVQIRFPPGKSVLAGKPFHEGIFDEIDGLLSQGYCPNGSFDLETEDTRLSCLIHRSVPHLSGVLEQGRYSWIPLREFPLRARQLEGATCNLSRSDPTRVFLAAIHFRNQPVLQASTELVDLAYVLNALTKEKRDAALALERGGTRTLLFLKNGVVTRLYFGNPDDDPGQGEIQDRFLAFAFHPDSEPGRVEVFKKLNIAPDPDAGTPLAALASAAKPPPPMSLLVRLGGRVVLQRPFMPPSMTIGRDLSCELLLDNLSVSRKHARLFWDQGKFYLEDLGSANGTTLNGGRVTRSVVNVLDRIGLGKFELALIEIKESRHPDATLVMRSGEPNSSPAYLVGADFSIPLEQEITIGRAPDVDVQARGPFVHKVHARIRPEAKGSFRMICTGNRKVKVNGRKTSTTYLRFGDQIQVGRSRFWLVPNLSGEPTNA